MPGKHHTHYPSIDNKDMPLQERLLQNDSQRKFSYKNYFWR